VDTEEVRPSMYEQHKRKDTEMKVEPTTRKYLDSVLPAVNEEEEMAGPSLALFI
jgi:hypothetical protein